jgi:hypothetical protein
VTMVMWDLVLVQLKTELASKQERCIVCVECSNGSKIVLDALNGTPR